MGPFRETNPTKKDQSGIRPTVQVACRSRLGAAWRNFRSIVKRDQAKDKNPTEINVNSYGRLHERSEFLVLETSPHRRTPTPFPCTLGASGDSYPGDFSIRPLGREFWIPVVCSWGGAMWWTILAGLGNSFGYHCRPFSQGDCFIEKARTMKPIFCVGILLMFILVAWRWLTRVVITSSRKGADVGRFNRPA